MRADRVRVRRWIVRSILALFAFPLGYLAWSQATANFATIEPERVYRSGQMSAGRLDQTIRARGIKTVLNLRGINPGQAWYRAERAATLAAGATQVDISMASCQWMSRAQLKVLAHALDTSERPLLIHCAWGSERTGLASAFVELLRPGSTLADARHQFSIRYLFVRAKDGAIMADHLDQYAAWLRKQGVAHSPDQFRRWVAEGFQPGTPSREQWPYDPYPLIVITRPAPAPPARLAGDESTLRISIEVSPAFRIANPRASDPQRTAPR